MKLTKPELGDLLAWLWSLLVIILGGTVVTGLTIEALSRLPQ